MKDTIAPGFSSIPEPGKRVKWTLIIVLLFLFKPPSFAQLTQTVKGQIIDKESKTAIPGAHIVLVDSDPVNGTISDPDGNFRLTVPVGRINLLISCIGYEEVTVSALEIIAGKETYLPVDLRESVMSLKEVVVHADLDKSQPVNSMATVSSRMISTEDANRYAAGYSDPARMVNSFAGVAPTEGDKNDIVIRGNSPRGLQWRLEGIEIPSPNHFSDGSGDTGGAFCIISSDVLSNSDFYTGAFPAEYGNVLAGILDLNLRNGNPDKNEFAVQIGVVGGEVAMEGPFKKGSGASYLINYRYANFQLLNRAGLVDLGENRRAPVFQDINFNIAIPSKSLGTFFLFGVGGISTTGKYGIYDSSRWIMNDELNDDEIEKHKMGAVGIKQVVSLKNKKTYLETILAATGQYDKWDQGYLVAQSDAEWFPAYFQNGYARLKYEYNEFSYPSIKFNFTLNHKFNAAQTLRAGITYDLLRFRLFDESYDYNRSYMTGQQLYNVRVDQKGASALFGSYVQWQYRINNRLEINSGLHFMLFRLNDHYSVEPRAGIKWQLTDNSAISYGFGIHSRVESIADYYTYIILPDGSKFQPNLNVDFTRAIHNVLGWDWSIYSNLHLKLEGYYQNLYRVPVKDNPTSTESSLNAQFGLPDTVYSNAGTGLNKGIELTLEKYYSNNYYFLVTTSLYDSKYRAGNGKLYNTIFNGNYLGNFLVGKDFKMGPNKQNTLGVNTRVLLKGGNRYTPIDRAKSVDGDPYYIYSDSYSSQMPYLLRFDLGIKYRCNRPGYSWIVSLDIQNVTDRKNIIGYHFNSTYNDLVPDYGLGLVPILNFRVEF